MVSQVVFDITAEGFKSWPFALAQITAICIAFLVQRNQRKLLANRRTKYIFVTCLNVALVTFMMWSVVSMYVEYRALVTALKEGKAETLEGHVTNFVPMPATGHSFEKFCVTGTCFQYSDFRVSPGFNNAASLGGPIREGLPVKVTHIGNTILKLEIAH